MQIWQKLEEKFKEFFKVEKFLDFSYHRKPKFEEIQISEFLQIFAGKIRINSDFSGFKVLGWCRAGLFDLPRGKNLRFLKIKIVRFLCEAKAFEL